MTLRPEALWPALLRQTEHALDCGALESIPTDHEIVDDGDAGFLVRIVSNLARKAAERRRADVLTLPGGRDFNPFLPHDEDLYVGDLSASHVALLNKYNVVDHHLLMVTRAFEDQDDLLSQADFEALWICLAGYEGLAFYNGGQLAGASQRHKHLQMVPLPLAPEGPAVPIEPLLASGPQDGSVGRCPALPFAHAFCTTPFEPEPTAAAAAASLPRYRELLASLDLIDHPLEPPARPNGPYNLLVTRRWMLLVPRIAECFTTISVNALGFAGALLVRNATERTALLRHGPLAALEHVAGTAAARVPGTGAGLAARVPGLKG